MTTSSSQNITTVSAPAAAFGLSHGYRFNGDSVELTASFRVLHRAAHQRAWSLQLWACAQAPERAAALNGQLIASAILPPLAEIADEVETFAVKTAAHLPAGQTDHVLVLALVAADANDRFNEIHDLAAYARREAFALPQFRGEVSAELRGEQVTVRLAGIENARDDANLSGTLSLELWALPAAYAGGDFVGAPVAGVVLGSIAGQTSWNQLEFNLPATPPHTTSRLTLMLREWNGVAYVTRDYVNLAEPFVVAVAPVAAHALTPAPKSSTKAKAAPAAAAVTDSVNVNTATVDELASVKGLTRPVAKGIVAARPIKQLDDLVEVKGFGPKMLAKLRAFLRVK